jgi:hypothetical protein
MVGVVELAEMALILRNPPNTTGQAERQCLFKIAVWIETRIGTEIQPVNFSFVISPLLHTLLK